MTLPLELGGLGDQYTRRALEEIAKQFPLHAANLANDVLLLSVVGTKRKVAFGSGSATWTAAIRSANSTNAHGLGVAPVYIGVTAAVTTDICYSVVSNDATNIVVAGFYMPNVNLSGTFGFTWVAIG